MKIAYSELMLPRLFITPLALGLILAVAACGTSSQKDAPRPVKTLSESAGDVGLASPLRREETANNPAVQSLQRPSRKRLPNGLLPGMMPRQGGVSPARGVDRSVTPTCKNPKLSYFGGPIIQSPQIVAVFWNSNVNSTVTAGIGQFYADITVSSYWPWLQEYDTVGLTGGTSQALLTGSFVGAHTIVPAKCATGTSSCDITDDDIQSELVRQIDAGVLPAPVLDCTGNVETIYMVHFPPNVSISGPDGVGTSCVEYCAYHNTGVYGSSTPLVYGVLPDEFSTECNSGCGANDAGTTTASAFANTTDTTSHELVESVTDPDIGLDTQAGYAAPAGWADNSNDCGEVADICDDNVAGDKITVDGRSWVVQEIWSNKQGKCTSSGDAGAVCSGTTTTGCRLCSCGDNNDACSGGTPTCETTSGNLLFGACEQCTSTVNECNGGVTCEQSSTTAASDDLCSFGVSPATATITQGDSYSGFSTSGGIGSTTWSVPAGVPGLSVNSSGVVATGSATPAASYAITVTDEGNTTATATLVVNPALAVTPTTQTIAQGDTSAAFTTTGGVGAVTWSVPAIAGLSVSGGAVTATSATPPASYVVTATDGLGNTASASITVNPALSLTPTEMKTVLVKGSFTLTAAGGVGTYSWSIVPNLSGASLDPSCQSSASCVYTAGTTSGVQDTVVVTDTSSDSASTVVTVDPDIAITPDNTTVQTHTQVQFSATGGSGSGYAWAFAASDTTPDGTITTGGAYVAGPTAGSDTVQVTDSEGNTWTTTITVTLPPVDAGSIATDAGMISPDAGSGASDAGSSNVDAGSTFVDAGPSPSDAGVIASDAGASALDAGTASSDAGSSTSVSDAGTALSDAGSTTSDAGSVGNRDGGSPPEDAGTRRDDAGVPGEDAGVSEDAGVFEADSGFVADAGVPGSDAGEESAVDAGVSPEDAGSPAADAGGPASAIRGGCNCGSGDSFTMLGLLALAVVRRRSRASSGSTA